MSQPNSTSPVIIVGAGLVGLTLAQALKARSIPFLIFEQDSSATSRTHQGWGITLHWSIPYLQELLPPDVFRNIAEKALVDPAVSGENDTGNFLFLNLATGEAKWKIPAARRLRVHRHRLWPILCEGIDVQWGKRFVDIRTPGSVDSLGVRHAVTALFGDGTAANGDLVIGADGVNSAVRKILRPQTYENNRLSVHFVGTALPVTTEQVEPIRNVDPLLFHGCHPTTGDFLWVSLLETPATAATNSNGKDNGTRDMWTVQICMSWLIGAPPTDEEVAQANASGQLVTEMKRRAAGFSSVFRDLVEAIPDDGSCRVSQKALVDWPPPQDWSHFNGAATLAGDAAHAMTMYRGEGVNHGYLDAFNLVKALENVGNGIIRMEDAISSYEAEMKERTREAVLLSRRACLEAHDWDGLNENSAVLKRRVMKQP